MKVAPAAANFTRMKYRPVPWSLNCAASLMLPPWAAGRPVTACTMPARSGQLSLRM